MEILGYTASLLIGISLGLIGGGGSILTVPVLVYLFGMHPVPATAYSLFIVGVTSLVGVVSKYRQKLVSIRTAIMFGIPSIISVYLTRKYLVPMIPDPVFSVGDLLVTKARFLMLLFALLMFIASVGLIRGTDEAGIQAGSGGKGISVFWVWLEGAFVGVLTGLVGAGGGFLIIPALVLLSKIPIKEAVGTSLMIIAAKSLVGFIGDLQHTQMDWTLLLSITALAVLGIFLGNRLNRKLSADSLRRVFGWFVCLMAVSILVSELI